MNRGALSRWCNEFRGAGQRDSLSISGGEAAILPYNIQIESLQEIAHIVKNVPSCGQKRGE